MGGSILKTVLLNGAGAGNALSERGLRAVQSALQETGCQVQAFDLEQRSIEFCKGCFGCWIRTPGECVIDDEGRDVARAYVQNDLVVLYTPITFGGYSSTLKRAVDRLIPNILPHFTLVHGEVHHKRRYRKYPRMAVVGVLAGRDAEEEDIFAVLAERNALNMWAPSYGVVVLHGEQDDAAMRHSVTRCLSRAGVLK